MLYGLIGKHLSHSKSAELFNEAFFPYHEYRLFELECVKEIHGLIERNKELCGFNITIPYKSEMLEYLDEVDEATQKARAVNTVVVKRKNNQISMKGYNTDISGFSKAYEQILSKKHTFALILGTGGAAKAVEFVLNKYNISYSLVSRITKNDNTVLFSDLIKHNYNISLIVNATPVGMFPNTNETIALPEKLFKAKPDCIDLIYNPELTSFMKTAHEYGCYSVNGMEMLRQQAYEAWKIWGLR